MIGVIIMDKLVQHIKMDMPGIPKQGLYCYGEACQVSAMEMRTKTLMEVKNDLQSRLEELV